MSDLGPTRDIGAAFADGHCIDEAVAEAYADAARRHKQAGVPLVVWRDGRVALIAPDDIVIPARPNREAA
jgi:hypothetical protein